MNSFNCPHCGAEVAAKRRSCPHCGASASDGWAGEPSDGGDWEERGWRENDDDDSANQDESDFDYDEYVEREFGQTRDAMAPLTAEQLRRRQVRFVIWAIIAALLMTAFLPAIL